ncbi:MAG: hypothetical protein AAGA48_00345 [Myxococcota bacterium]
MIRISLAAAFAVACADGGPGSMPLPSDYGLFLANAQIEPGEPQLESGTVEAMFEADDRLDLETVRAEAQTYMTSEFGFDLDEALATGRVMWIESRVDPRADYRVFALPDREVSAEGWRIDDAAFSAVVVDPNGLPLGGVYEGMVQPPGVLGTYGYYRLHADEGEPLLIQYESDGPGTVDALGRGLFHCRLSSEVLGTGLARVVYDVTQTPDGAAIYDIANVQTWRP